MPRFQPESDPVFDQPDDVWRPPRLPRQVADTTTPGGGGGGSGTGTGGGGGAFDPTTFDPYANFNWPSDPQSGLISLLQSGGAMYQDFVDRFNRHYGLQPGSSLAQYADPGQPGHNIYALPGGYAAVGPGGQWGWNVRREGGGGGGGEFQMWPSGGFDPRTFQAPWLEEQKQRGNALYDYLMGRAKQSLDVSEKDPIIKNQVDAYAARSADEYRNLMSQQAEKGGAYFNPSAVSRSAAERLSKGTGDFQATLMQNELTARRQEIQQALSQSGQLLSAQQTNALNEELAMITALMGESQFGRNLAERAFEFGATVNP